MVVVSLSSTSASDPASFASSVVEILEGNSFEADLAANLGAIGTQVVVSGVDYELFTRSPSLHPTVYLPPANGKTATGASSAASSSVILIGAVFGVVAVIVVGLVGRCIFVRVRKGKGAPSEADIEWAGGHSNVSTRGPGGSVPTNGPTLTELTLVRSATLDRSPSSVPSVYHIPRNRLQLESKPFAKGGGGNIYKGAHSPDFFFF